MVTLSRVVVVVLNYQNPADTVRCVRAMRDSDFRELRILVVDNAADGPATQSLRDQLGNDVVVIASGGNLGYAGGNNLGIAWAEQWSPEFVLLINPDVLVEPDTISGLVRAANEHPDAGIIGCRILQGGSQPARIASDGGRVVAERLGATVLRNSGRFADEVIETDVREVSFVSGACLLIRHEMIRAMGMLPEEYFLYYEETEYCLRALRAGWRIVVNPSARVWHFKQSSGVLPSASYIYYMCRNRIHFAQRNFAATAEEVIEELGPFVEIWRTRVRQHAPELLATFDEIVRRAVDDGRAGRFGRRTDLDALPFTVAVHRDSVARERDLYARDLTRLLARIKKDATELARLRVLKHTAEQERRRRRALEAELHALRVSRSYRLGRTIGTLARQMVAARRAIAGRMRKVSGHH